MPTSDIPPGPPLIAYTCQAKATRNAPSPTSDAVAPLHSSRKSRATRSGVRTEPVRATRSAAPASVQAS